MDPAIWFFIAINLGALLLWLLIQVFLSALPVRVRYSSESPAEKRGVSFFVVAVLVALTAAFVYTLTKVF